jgi:hypothetical protein
MTEPPEETPTGEPDAKPPAKKSAKKAPARKAAAKKAPAAKAPDAETAEPPATESPAAEPPASETPVTESPAEPPPAGGTAAAAARRARRIGGRPAGAARTDAGGEPTAPAAESTTPVPLQKSAVPAVQPASAAEPHTVVVTAVPAWLNWAPAAVLSVGALVMAVLLLVFSHGVWWGPDPKSAPSSTASAVLREQVLAAAKTCLAATNSYQYTNLDAYETKALACATGDFRAQLQDTIEHIVKANAPSLKASQTAHITQGGIENVNTQTNQWTILLYGQLDVVNTNYPKGRTDPFAADVVVQRVAGKWLISKLTPVASL